MPGGPLIAFERQQIHFALQDTWQPGQPKRVDVGWVYYFSRQRPGPGGEELGAYHGTEIPYVFDMHDDWLPTEDIDHELTTAVMDYWVQFARNGDPNLPGHPQWPVYDGQRPFVMQLGDTVETMNAHDEELCKLLGPSSRQRNTGLMKKQKVDWPSFSASVTIILVASIGLILFPESGGEVLLELYGLISSHFAFLYLFAGVATLLLLVWLAMGRYGKVRLASGDEQPEFSTLSWVAMLFCAGVGAGLMFWAPIEWAYYIDAPPFGLEPGSNSAAAWASTYGIFHWGPTAWAFYCLPTIAIAYPYYVKKVPYLRLSTSCHYFLAGKEDSGAARVIDWLFMIGLLGGAGTSLGFSTPMIAAAVGRVTGWEADFGLEFGVVAISVVIFGTSVWFGLKKGIKRLSDINMWLAFVLLAFVLVVGPTIFLLNTSMNSIGLMTQNFIRMNTWTDVFTNSGFVKNWTIFYWAWWIAYGPFVGLFVTRISRGRTIKQVIFGMLVYGSLGRCPVLYDAWKFWALPGNH